MTSSLYNTQTDAKLIWSGVGYSSFATIDATLSRLTITYIRVDDTIVYNYTLTDPRFIPGNWTSDGEEDNPDNNNDQENDDKKGDGSGDDNSNPHPPIPHDSSQSTTTNSNKVIQIVMISASIGGVLGIISLGIVMFFRRSQLKLKGFQLLSMNSPYKGSSSSTSSSSALSPTSSLPNKKQKSRVGFLHTRFNDENNNNDIEKQKIINKNKIINNININLPILITTFILTWCKCCCINKYYT